MEHIPCRKVVLQPMYPQIVSFSIIKRCRKYTWYATSSNKTMYWIYKHLTQTQSLASNNQHVFLKKITIFLKFKFLKKLRYSVIFFWAQSELPYAHWRRAHVDSREDDEKRRHRHGRYVYWCTVYADIYIYAAVSIVRSLAR